MTLPISEVGGVTVWADGCVLVWRRAGTGVQFLEPEGDYGEYRRNHPDEHASYLPDYVLGSSVEGRKHETWTVD